MAERITCEALLARRPLLLAVEGDRKAARATRDRLAGLPPTAAAVLGPRPAGANTWRIDVVPRAEAGPLSAQSEALVEDT